MPLSAEVHATEAKAGSLIEVGLNGEEVMLARRPVVEIPQPNVFAHPPHVSSRKH